MKRKNIYIRICIIWCLVLLCYGYAKNTNENIYDVIGDSTKNLNEFEEINNVHITEQVDTLLVVPKFSGDAYIVINDNNPCFSVEEKRCKNVFETYRNLDKLGRCEIVMPIYALN